jgi:LPS O-antigen subunit length determinant protein (WzzB/FepE family)
MAQTSAAVRQLEKECREETERRNWVKDFRELEMQIRARYVFLKGESAFHKSEFEKARMHYVSAIALQGEDSERANVRLEQISAFAELEKQAQSALRDAIEYCNRKLLAQAIRRLKNKGEGVDWTIADTRSRDRIVELYGEWLKKWERQIVQELKVLQKISPLLIREIECLLAVLCNEIGDPIVCARWRARLLPDRNQGDGD